MSFLLFRAHFLIQLLIVALSLSIFSEYMKKTITRKVRGFNNIFVDFQSFTKITNVWRQIFIILGSIILAVFTFIRHKQTPRQTSKVYRYRWSLLQTLLIIWSAQLAKRLYVVRLVQLYSSFKKLGYYVYFWAV